MRYLISIIAIGSAVAVVGPQLLAAMAAFKAVTIALTP